MTIDASTDEAMMSQESGAAAVLFSSNIEALSNRQPHVAARIEHAALPNGAQLVVARDGHMTYQIRTPAGRRVWLGGSSLPSVSAEALLNEFVSDGSSVVLPGMATGREPIVLASRLPSCAAVFVAEQDPAVVRMAFELYDYTELLTSGRLIIMTGEQIGEVITALFSTHTGYAWPNHLLPLIQFDQTWSVNVQAQLEQVSLLVANRQEKVVNRLIETISNRWRVELPSSVRRVALLSTNASSMSFAITNAIRRNLDNIHWPMSMSVPDTPDSCHITARLSAIEGIRADLVLFINCLPGSMIALLPSHLHTASWFWPGTVLNASVHDISQSGHEHLVLVSSLHQKDQLVAMGVDVQRVTLLPVGADITNESPRQIICTQDAGSERSVTVLADIPDDRPEIANVSLSSQVRLWETLQQVVSANVDQYNHDCLDKFLQEAQQQSGTILSDDSSRLQFRELLRLVIGPACYARAIAEILASPGTQITVSGANWCLHERWKACCQDTTANCHQASNRNSDASIMVIPTIDDTIVPRLLNALAHGTAVIARSGLRKFDTEYPGLDGIAEHIHWFSTTGNLLKILRHFAANPDQLATACDRQAKFVRDHHTIDHRLRSIDRMTR